MLKKILLTTLFSLLTAGLGGGYLYHAGNYARKCSAERNCTAIDIRVLDSLEASLVSSHDVMGFIPQGAKLVGKSISQIDLHDIESALRSRGEILSAEAYCRCDGSLGIDLTQRHAKLRFNAGEKAFYCDSVGYVFPISKNVDVPVFTGQIPIAWSAPEKGMREDPAEIKWLEGALALGNYIENNWFYHGQIEQIDVAQNGDVVLYTRDGSQKFIFGDFSDIDEKFAKISLFYKGPGSEKGGKQYTTVNVKYKNQIICR